MRRQKGMTLVGMLGTAIIVILAATVIMQVIPVYIKYFEVMESIKSLSGTPAAGLSGDPIMDVTVLRRDLAKRLLINGVEDFKDSYVTITPDGPNKYKIVLKYQETRSLVSNVSLLFDFGNTVEVSTSSEN